MGSLLETIITGKTFEPPRILLYGPEGIGKTTFGASAPAPIFIPTEDGQSQVGCARFPLATKLTQIDDYLNTLLREDHKFQSVVIDSADWLEKLIFDAVCERFGVSVIEKADGGWGNGYKHALNSWSELLSKLEQLRRLKGMAVIFLAHSDIRPVRDPESATYDQVVPRMQKLAVTMVTEWVDAIFYATRRIRTEKEGDRTIAHAIGANGGERIMKTTGGPGRVAKNRYNLPDELPLAWDAFISALQTK